MLRPFFAERSLTPDRVKPAEVPARIACLSSFYRFLIRMGLVVSNPCDAVERPRAIQSVARGDSADEVRRLLAVLRTTSRAVAIGPSY
jgi:site-specific recombinase XerC